MIMNKIRRITAYWKKLAEAGRIKSDLEGRTENVLYLLSLRIPGFEEGKVNLDDPYTKGYLKAIEDVGSTSYYREVSPLSFILALRFLYNISHEDNIIPKAEIIDSFVRTEEEHWSDNAFFPPYKENKDLALKKLKEMGLVGLLRRKTEEERK